jgi:hypothetical protein
VTGTYYFFLNEKGETSPGVVIFVHFLKISGIVKKILNRQNGKLFRSKKLRVFQLENTYKYLYRYG